MSPDPDPKPTSLTWNLFITCSSLAVAYFLYFLYKMIIYTKLKMRFYRQQGINCYYCPLIGRFFRHGAALKNHGDVEYENKFKAREAPERALCTNFGYDVSVVLYDPALIKEFFLNPDNYVKDNLFLELHFPIIGTGLITSEGSQWKGQRKKLSNAFHFEFLKSNLPLTLVTAQKILYNLRDGNMQKVPIMDVLKKITGEVVGKTFFGENLDLYQFQEKPLTEGLTDLLMEIGVLNASPERYLLGSWLIKKGVLPKHKKLMQKIRTLRKLCEKIIQDRKELIKTGKQTTRTRDILDLLLGYPDEKEPQYTEEIIDQFVTLFLAGMDTTAHMLRMAMYFLHAYPEMKERITKEVEQYYRQGGSVTIDNLNKLEFMTAFLKETIRTMTPVPRLLPRKAIRDHKLGDISIRKGDLVELEFFYNNFNPEYFGEPDKFNPDRWLDRGKPIEVYGFTPFSGGPRNCIGQHLALIEARVILAEFLTMYNSSLIEGYKLKMEFRLQYEPVDPVLLNLVPKS